jgi:hypothetical protein
VDVVVREISNTWVHCGLKRVVEELQGGVVGRGRGHF